MTSIAVPALVPRRARLTDLPVLLVAVVWGAGCLAAKDITTARTVVAVRCASRSSCRCWRSWHAARCAP